MMTILSTIYHKLDRTGQYLSCMTMIITVLLVTNVQAEVFRWTDSNGVIHSTDNIAGQAGSVQASPREMDASDWLAAIQGSWRRTSSTPAQLELAFKVLNFFEEIQHLKS